MYSFITTDLDVNKQIIHGGIGRYKDFFLFLKDIGIEFSTKFRSKSTNIIDSNAIIEDSSVLRIGEPLDTDIVAIASLYHNLFSKVRKYKNSLIHNLYFASEYKYGFLPMFVYKEYPRSDLMSSKEKYGIYYTPYDGNSFNILNIINLIGANNVLVLTKNTEDFPGILDKKYQELEFTDNTANFFSKIHTILEPYDPYTGRHVTSRFMLEATQNYVPITCFCNKSFKPSLNTFKPFRHVSYKHRYSNGDYEFYDVKYIANYFNTSTYRNYIVRAMLSSDFKLYSGITSMEDLYEKF